MLIWASFSVFRLMIDEFTAQKVNMLGNNFRDQLLQYIDPNCLEQKFGGNLLNKVNEFFPPDMEIPSEQMLTISDYYKSI